jgi:hypothetical protein
VLDEGYQTVRLLVRSDGRYRLDTSSTDASAGYSLTESGRYELDGAAITFVPYAYLGEPQTRQYGTRLTGGSLTLTRVEFEYSQEYQLEPGSRDAVLAGERAASVLIGTWGLSVRHWGRAEYTFRPGGYYVLKNTPESSQFPPEFIRGRYSQDGATLTLRPYSGVVAQYELDFFGETLTLIRRDQFSGESATYEKHPGSEAAVRAKATEAEAFLGREHWHVGLWEIRDAIHTVDLTIRPDGHYVAKEDTRFLAGIVRGRYTLEPGRIHLQPFVGQGLYARSNGEFGRVERTRALDYYDGELQFIDLEAISQS